jgi:hypothetical protein
VAEDEKRDEGKSKVHRQLVVRLWWIVIYVLLFIAFRFVFPSASLSTDIAAAVTACATVIVILWTRSRH